MKIRLTNSSELDLNEITTVFRTPSGGYRVVLRNGQATTYRRVLLTDAGRGALDALAVDPPDRDLIDPPGPMNYNLKAHVESIERIVIRQALNAAGSRSGAARLLGISLRTLQYRLKDLGLLRSAWEAWEPADSYPAVAMAAAVLEGPTPEQRAAWSERSRKSAATRHLARPVVSPRSLAQEPVRLGLPDRSNP